jgi:antitoxin component YwqK of YwqJK toxin-antitoxin module
MYFINETGKVTFCGSYVHQRIWMILRQKDLHEQAEKDGSMLDGQVISYRDEGQIESILNFKDGEFNGPAMRFYRNGKLEFYMDMKDGMIDGSVFHFDKNGLLMDIFRGEKEWINSHFYIFSDSSSIKTIIDVNPQYPKGNIIYSAPDNSD